ncbi:MAG: site-2 protease family protein [Acidobacteriota bacterium]
MSEPASQFEIIGPDGISIGVIRPLPPPPRRIWLHGALFLATLISTTLVGGFSFADLPQAAAAADLWQLLFHPAVLRAGLQFSLPLLAILLTHEMAHWLACRAHRLDSTLPFFIPIPIGIGTFGAFIKIRTPIASKRELLDVGASGPLAGFLVSIPVLFAGIALSQPVAELPRTGYVIFGEPLLFQLVSSLIHPNMPAGGDIWLHPTGFAAWFGLFATALNLLPFGQLDGGHVSYALFGRFQRQWAWPLLIILVILGFRWHGWWLWAVVALVMGVRHPRVPDESAELDWRRRLVAWICIVVFALCFTPEPIRLVP